MKEDKNANKPKLLSLFSGCGGLDLGFEKAGYDVVWANDHEHWSCQTLKKNFHGQVVEADIADIDFEKTPDVDIITGGFPCQDFSMIWKRGGLETNRGNLYRFFVKAVKTKMPKVFVAENVKGLLTANGGKAIRQIVKDFAEVGYKIDINLYNFANYGAPQLRERVLIVGVRHDLEFEFSKPEPTHTPETYVTAGQALEGAEKVPYNNEHQNIKEKTREMLKLIPEGGNFSALPKDSPYYVKGMISHVYRRLDRNKPSTTIIAGGGGGTWGYHFEEPRPLTNRERARLFGYPDNFVFEGSITEVRRQIGNSVPPVAAKAIAEHLLPAFKANSVVVVNQKNVVDYTTQVKTGLLTVRRLLLALE
ncbi:MAG TPA: DNA cytosine methyltransferase [bacterium]|nr:DNA cytosine methyltransferase [bacterium]